jgi:hypothetical protein
VLRLAAEVGARAVHAGGGVDLALVEPLARAAARIGIEIASATLPLPERPLPAARRLPRLGALAADERAAAIALAERGLGAVGGSARRLLLDFGPVTLGTRATAVTRAFARRALDEDDPGATALSAALEERRARGPAVVDACRWVLERLLRVAERLGATLVLPVGATPWDAPSPREAGTLAALFAGAPLACAWDPGRLSVLAALGLPISDERLRALAAGAPLALENDAVGLAAGYLPGLGERDPRVAALAPPASAAVVIVGAPDATGAEVTTAIAGCRTAPS